MNISFKFMKAMTTKILFLSFLFIGNARGQTNWKQRIDDNWFSTFGVNGLMVGDVMPDIMLGTVLNNQTGKLKFSDFKGKLIILDFWATSCSPCIEGFPKMEKLQEKFGDKIQIILVNPYENETEIKQRAKNFVLPNLPCIVQDSFGNSKKLSSLFPSRTLGHQVWIDGNGVIRLRGMSLNNTPEKISDLLKGKEIFVLNDNGTAHAFDPKYPYYKLLGEFNSNPLMYGSYITQFNNEYEPENIGVAEKEIDTIAGTLRNTYINNYLLSLYSLAFGDYLRSVKEKVLYGPGPRSYIGKYGYHLVILPKDTLRYTGEFFPSIKRTDKDFIKPRVCYEQILPLNTSLENQRLYMVQDLNKYFGNLYGTEAQLETHRVPCYILINKSPVDKLTSKSEDYPSTSKVSKNGKMLNVYRKTTIEIIGDFIGKNKAIASLFWENNKKGKASLLLNETKFNNKNSIDIELPEPQDIRTLEELRQVLNKYNLDIIEDYREIKFLVITDNSGK